MTATQENAPTAKSVRLIHGALVLGILLFAAVSHFVLRESMANDAPLSSAMVQTLLGVAIAACVAGLLLHLRVPKRPSDASADSFWRTAASPALVAWAPLEGASLAAIYVYTRTGTIFLVAIAASALLLFVTLNPAYLERR